MGARGLANIHLSGRPKNLYSIHKKMGAKGKDLEQLYDVRALRIVTRSKADCYRALREVFCPSPPPTSHLTSIQCQAAVGHV